MKWINCNDRLPVGVVGKPQEIASRWHFKTGNTFYKASTVWQFLDSIKNRDFDSAEWLDEEAEENELSSIIENRLTNLYKKQDATKAIEAATKYIQAIEEHVQFTDIEHHGNEYMNVLHDLDIAIDYIQNIETNGSNIIKQLQLRLATIHSEPAGIVRETMIQNLLVDL